MFAIANFLLLSTNFLNPSCICNFLAILVEAAATKQSDTKMTHPNPLYQIQFTDRMFAEMHRMKHIHIDKKSVDIKFWH